MNAANNLALMPIGPAVADHDRHAMNEPTTKQDLYNMGVHIDSNFGKVISQFTIVESEFVNLRTDMNAGFRNLRTDMDSQFVKLRAEISEQFSKVYVLIEKSKSETRALLSKSTAANTLLMVAILSIDRWWR
jgi:hypothetical protein